MNFEDFENLARLYVVGALDEEEMDRFLTARRKHGGRAEATITEFRRLNSVFALSLRPHAPSPETKHKLLAKIRESIGQEENKSGGNGENGGTGANRMFGSNMA